MSAIVPAEPCQLVTPAGCITRSEVTGQVPAVEATPAVAEAMARLQQPSHAAPSPRSRRRSMRAKSGDEWILPWARGSKEFLVEFFEKSSIDCDEVLSSKDSRVSTDLRQTLHSPQSEQLVPAVAQAVIGHVQRSLGSPARVGDNVFDEDQYPLGRDAQMAHITVATTHDAVMSWLWTILDAIALDAECLLISLVLVERALSKQSAVRLTPSTWRPILLSGLLVTSKDWYDGRVFNLDYAERLDEYITLPHLNAMEAEFLGLLDYRTTISASLYAQCDAAIPTERAVIWCLADSSHL